MSHGLAAPTPTFKKANKRSADLACGAAEVVEPNWLAQLRVQALRWGGHGRNIHLTLDI